MNRISGLALAFSIAFLVFFVGPPLLSMQFGPYTLMKVGDVFDLLTPLALLPLYWLLFRAGQEKTPGHFASIAFLIIAAIWVEGQGMHLSANSIGHTMKQMVGSDAFNLTDFYDEVLSHYLWHFGVIALSALTVVQQWKNPAAGAPAALWPAVLAAIIYGFTFFMIVVEGQTAPLGVTFAVLVALYGLVWGRSRLRKQPVLALFFVGYLVSTILFVAWAVYWGGLPEFSAVGIID